MFLQLSSNVLCYLESHTSSFFLLNYLFFPQDSATKEKALHTMSSMSSAQIVSATAMHSKPPLGLAPPPVSYASPFWQGGLQAGTSQE